MLIEIINRKLGYIEKNIIKVNTFKVKASQLNHIIKEKPIKMMDRIEYKEICIQQSVWDSKIKNTFEQIQHDTNVLNKSLSIKVLRKLASIWILDIQRKLIITQKPCNFNHKGVKRVPFKRKGTQKMSTY